MKANTMSDARRISSRRRPSLVPWLFISPWILGFLFFTLGPMVFSLMMSLHDWPVVGERRFVGLDNYRVMLTQDPELDPVVLVGGIAATLGDRLSTMLLEALERHGMYEVTTRDPGWFRRRIRLGALDDDSGLIGCGVFAHGFAGGPGAFA